MTQIRNLIDTNRCTLRINNAMIMVTGCKYDDGSEVWFVDSHPHITGNSEAQLEARIIERGLWQQECA